MRRVSAPLLPRVGTESARSRNAAAAFFRSHSGQGQEEGTRGRKCLHSMSVLAAVSAAALWSSSEVIVTEGLPAGAAPWRVASQIDVPSTVNVTRQRSEDKGGLTTYQRMLQQGGGVGQLTTIQKMVLLADEDADGNEDSDGGISYAEPDLEDIQDKVRKVARLNHANRGKSRSSAGINAVQWRAAGQSGYGMADDSEFYQEDEGGRRRGKSNFAKKKEDDVEGGRKERFVVINGIYYNVSDSNTARNSPTDAQILMSQLHNRIRSVTEGNVKDTYQGLGFPGPRRQDVEAKRHHHPTLDVVSSQSQANGTNINVDDVRYDRQLGHFYDVRYDQELGTGSFSVVRPAVEKSTGAEVAIKFVDRRMADDEMMYGEVDVMRHLAGGEKNAIAPASILRLRDVFETPQALCLVLERADGGALFDHVLENGDMGEQAARPIFEEVLVALKFMHDCGVCHSDIKPENIILTRDEMGEPTGVKLCDFGLSRHYDSQGSGLLDSYQTGAMKDGTWAYWAPELLKSESVKPPVDIWAAGVVLYIMLCGRHPFDPEGENNEIHLIQNIAKGKYDETNDQYRLLSPGAKDLLKRVLDPDPLRRLTAEEALSHPWIRSQE
jgi:hypothetical protein